ncbi:MAG: nickel-dependent hydrogenase large subunit [Deltaproteobacteria bacterium]|nr:nickel-dependent hydrogenase large subunit [Deltaproteobacteria bacterium]
MSAKKIQVIAMNRVEGDLEVHLEMEDGLIREARCVGTMFRGIENLLLGRGLLDGLVITPRICGICTTAQLKAAAKALDVAFEADVPDNGRRIRNITLMVEMLQNDIRHAFLLFLPDFTNSIYRSFPFYDEIVNRYAPLKGRTVIETIKETKRILEITAILGGQWPHSSFMVPGGVVSVPSISDLATCRYILGTYRRWYESRVLGCSLSRWSEIRSKADLLSWLDEKPSHGESELGFFIRISMSVGLQSLGAAHGNFLSFGALDLPAATDVAPLGQGETFMPGGFYRNGRTLPFRQENILEDVSHARFDDDTSVMHPFRGLTVPGTSDSEEKYSWAKAPRYKGLPAETGPLAEMVLSNDPLFLDLIKEDGPGVFARELARLSRPALLIPVMEQWLKEVADDCTNFFTTYRKRQEGKGSGLIEAPRGALGHWLTFEKGKITNYQVVTPTTWNASPRDADGERGPMEEALVGTPVRDPDNPVEAEHVVRSFDPCLVCTVHTVDLSGRSGRRTNSPVMVWPRP